MPSATRQRPKDAPDRRGPFAWPRIAVPLSTYWVGFTNQTALASETCRACPEPLPPRARRVPLRGLSPDIGFETDLMHVRSVPSSPPSHGRHVQRGSLRKLGQRDPVWELQWREDHVNGDGSIRRRLVTKIIGPVAAMTQRQARKAADEILRPLNWGKVRPGATMTLREFVDRHFIPNAFPNREPSALILQSARGTQLRDTNLLHRHTSSRRASSWECPGSTGLRCGERTQRCSSWREDRCARRRRSLGMRACPPRWKFTNFRYPHPSGRRSKTSRS